MIWTRKKILTLAKGYRGRANNCVTLAFRRVEKALQYAYVQRRLKKRMMRRLWITKMSSVLRASNLNYSRFIHGISKSSIQLDRKILSNLAEFEPLSFQAVIKQLQEEGVISQKISAGITLTSAINQFVKIDTPSAMKAAEKDTTSLFLIKLRHPEKVTEKEDTLRLLKREEDDKWVAEKKKLTPNLKEMKKIPKAKGKEYLLNKKFY